MRTSHPCDGCALRRVRCAGGQPCLECKHRSISCTFLRVRRKRGPKGPRPGTTLKIEQFQKTLQDSSGDHHSMPTPPEDSSTAQQQQHQQGPSHHQSPASSVSTHSHSHSDGIPLKVYERFLEIFHHRLYSVWPIVSSDELLARLRKDRDDHEAYSLAAALCAAVIAQLRLPEHVVSFDCISSFELAMESQRLRQLFEFQEHFTVTSLLTSFFLHIYFANASKLRTAGFYLRESLTYAHGLKMHQLHSYTDLSAKEQQVRLRVFWILFVSERTYCIQNDLPITLRPIAELPNADPLDGHDNSPMPAFIALARLFIFLDGDFLESTASSDAASISAHGHHPKEKVSNIQHELVQHQPPDELNESQRVDIMTTRNWVRILLWNYTISHFTVSCHAQDQAFSALLPATVAHDMLSVLGKASWKSVQPHGYGMELKTFRIADSLLDVLLCAPASARTRSLLTDSRESLHLLEKVLIDIGGTNSKFLSLLRKRMVESQLPAPQTLWNDLQISSPHIQASSPVSAQELQFSSPHLQDSSPESAQELT